MAKSVTVDRVKIIAEMARQNITGVELAQKAGVGRCTIQSMRAGKSVWRTTAQHVAGALGVPLEDLMDGG
jgi:transcriptional regulator with XRE-family HTH domain